MKSEKAKFHYISNKDKLNKFPVEITDKEESKKLILENLTKQKMLIGDGLNFILQKVNFINKTSPVWNIFIEALNKSDWLKSAYLVNKHKEYFLSLLKTFLQVKKFHFISDFIVIIYQLYLSNELFKDNKYYGRWLIFGTYPVFVQENGSDDLGENVDFFRKLNLQNILCRKKILSSQNIPIYIENDHNWSYYFWHKTERSGYFNKNNKKLLVHFDSHEDFGPISLTKKQLQLFLKTNKTDEETALISGTASIGNYITPAVFSGFIDEIIWVVPEEARQRPFNNCAWINQNGYRINNFLSLTLTKDNSDYQINPKINSLNYQRKSRKDLVKNIKLHIISPGADSRNNLITGLIYNFIGKNKNNIILLDIDFDFFGTVEPMPWRRENLPDFRLNRKRFNELLRSIKKMYENNKIRQAVRSITMARSHDFSKKTNSEILEKKLLKIFTDS